MSEKLDQFAQELLEKTRAHKLEWRVYRNSAGHGREEYLADVGEGYYFQIWRRVSGDDRTISLQLRAPDQPTTIDSTVNNWPRMVGGVPTQEIVSRFRLYSDLFDAVRESVYGPDETLGKVEELLRKIG
jgi:hypothetical protein